MNRSGIDPIQLLAISDPAAPHIRLLGTLPESVRVEIGMEEDFLREAAPRADVVVNATFSGEPFRFAWPLATRLRWAHTLSAGVEHLMTPALASSPVPFTNARGVYKRSLAEFALAGMLYFAKNFPLMLRNQRAHRWERFEVEELAGRALGVVGYGEIGRAAARLAHAFGMKILALRRRDVPEDGDPLAAVRFSPERLREMLPLCDYVLVATPLTAETRGMIGEADLRTMKNTAVIVNVGRGPVVDEAALIRALSAGWIRGAALDVFEHEPLPSSHPFWGMENVLISPHTADQTATWLDESMLFFLENFRRFRDGEPLKNLVDKQASY